jgi:hypothetical protein
MLSVVMLKVKAPFGWLLTGSRKDGEKVSLKREGERRKKFKWLFYRLAKHFYDNE